MDYQLKYHTFGCKVNTYDTGLIQKNLNSSKLGFENEASKNNSISDSDKSLVEIPKVHVLNTCAVTQEATKEAVKLIRKLKKQDPNCKVVVTGCGAQVDTDFFVSNMVDSDLVVANSHKGLLPQIIQQHLAGVSTEKIFKSNIFKKEDLELGGGLEDNHTRSFLKIQDGCNSFCTYCIIPFARGKSRSIPVKDLVLKVNELYQSGIKEVVITGIHIADYEDESEYQGNSEKKYLDDLIEILLKDTLMPRFRISSLEPREITDRLLDMYSDDRLCPHFHLSIQSASDLVLQKMKRRYLQKDVIQILNRIQAKLSDAFIGMDVISGFNFETDLEFEETYKILTESFWTKLHVFPYSERPGTMAMKLEQTVPNSVRHQRATRLRELSLHRYQSVALKQIGKMDKVLIFDPNKKKNTTSNSSFEEQEKENQDPSKLEIPLEGLTRKYWNIRLSAKDLNSAKEIINTERPVRLVSYHHPDHRLDGYFKGELL